MDSPATPALIIDAPVVERNLIRLAEYAAKHEIDIRPHTKTHKSRQIAAMQLAAGAVGLTAAKVGEVEVMSEVCDDILLAYPAIDTARTNRLAILANHKTVRVAVDSREAATALSQAARNVSSTIGVLVDIDVGLGRTGLQTPGEALKLAQYIDGAPGLRLDGIMIYPGHITVPASQQAEPLARVSAKLDETLEIWAAHGLQARIVSGGSTPTAFQSHLVEDITEIRPGTYVYNDINTFRAGFCTIEDCAARIECTVVSTAVPRQFVIDAGSKTLTSDRCTPALDSGHGLIMEYPHARIVKLSEEHGQVTLGEDGKCPRVGDRVTVIPNHICPCVNLQDVVYWRTADGALQPLPIDARGRLS